MTPEQKTLLKNLRDCRERGSASQQVSKDRLQYAHELEKMGLAAWHGNSYGGDFYYITEKGLKTNAQ